MQVCCFYYSCLWAALFVVGSLATPSPRFIRISNKQIVAYNNRNLTIVCRGNLAELDPNKTYVERGQELSFTLNARMVLSFLSIPRDPKPLHQMQSFVHCVDPKRTVCYSEFNFDVSCIEDQMNYSYYYNVRNYTVEAVCQVDDVHICSHDWIVAQKSDCYDLGLVTVVNEFHEIIEKTLRPIKPPIGVTPKLEERCVHGNETQECGYNQDCSTKYGICLCSEGYIALNRQCIPSPQPLEPVTETEMSADDFYTQPGNDYRPKVASAGNNTFKAIVIFLLIVAILLCIALGIVIIWSRHYRRLIEDVNRH